jgi:hypothetical protein
MSPTRRQAAFLRALADHLDNHPDLAPVNLTNSWDPNPSLQIALHGRPITEADVNAWAASVGAQLIRVKLVASGEGYLHATGVIGGTEVDVWSAVGGEYFAGDVLAVEGGASDA